MTAPYKKRAKAGWNTDKDQSNKDERAFEKKEIKELTSEELRDSRDAEFLDMLDQMSKPPKKPKKKASKAKDIRNKIHSTERTLDFFKKGYQSDWIKGVINRYEKELKDLNDLLKEMENK